MARIQVEISNYTTGEILRSQLVVVRGIVTSNGESNHQLELSRFLQIQRLGKEIPFKAKGSQFLFVSELHLGSNSLVFLNRDDESVLQTLDLQCELEDSEEGHVLIPAFVRCNDSKDSDWEKQLEIFHKKFDTALKLIQAFYEEKLLENGLQRKTFRISKTPKHFLLNISQSEIASMVSADLVWKHLAEIITSEKELCNPLLKYVAIMMEPYFPGKSKEDNTKVACGSGGLALLAFNCLESWPNYVSDILPYTLNDSSVAEGNSLAQVANVLGCEKKFSTVYCTSLGSLAHELGHIFDLGHEDNGIMGKGFYNFSQFLDPLYTEKCNDSKKRNFLGLGHSSAKILFHHRWFNPLHQNLEIQDAGPRFIGHQLISSIPLVAIQIRHPETGDMIKDIKTGKGTKITLFKQDIPSIYDVIKLSLVAADTAGNILKTLISRSELPNGFTALKRANII